MPVCAFLGCVAIGWIMGPKKAVAEMEADGQKLGFFKPIFLFFVKFVTPILILVIEIFGVFDLIFPKGEAGRVFSSDGLGITLTAYGLLLLGVIAYFAFFKKGNTGCNADEE